MNLFRGLLIAAGWLLFAYLCWLVVTTPRPATALQTMEDFNAYYLAFDTGQVATSLMSVLAGVWIARKTGHGFIAGCLLALACWIKVYPAFIVIFFLWRRDWPVVKGVAVAGMALGLLQLILAPQDLIHYFTTVLPQLNAEGQPMLNQGGASTLGFAELVAPSVAQPMRWLLSLACVAGSLLVTRRFSIRTLSLDYAIMLITAAVIGATYLLSGWVNLFLLAAIVLTCDRSARAWVVIGVVYTILTTVPLLTLGILPRNSSGWLAYLPFLAFMLIWGYMAWLRVRQGRETKTDAVTV